MSQDYHTPVLLDECVAALDIKPDGVYVDVTYGGGGHSKPILNRLTAKGRLFGFDQDEYAVANAIEQDNFTFVKSNFRYIKHFMKYYGIDKVDGILADLGVSSFHFDEPSRGFSYRFDTALDMRMNESISTTAADILRQYSQSQLQDIFSKYGEVRNAKTLAKVICEVRRSSPLEKSSDLMDIVSKCYRGDRQKYASQVYQALRIEVNDEMGVLAEFLEAALGLLSPGGRLVVMSYHSLEDKIVKKYLKYGASGKLEQDEFGRAITNYKQITKRPMVAPKEEIERNSRAASAKLRVVERLEEG